MPQQLYKKLIISKISQETPEVKIFYFEEAAKRIISFKAGQYLTFIFRHEENEVRRSYSIAASPILDEPICIGIKRIINGVYSRKLFDNARVGDSLVTLGPGGVFTLPEEIQSINQIFFFAAGSGIIPIYSLIKTVLYAYPHIEIILIYSNSSIQKTVFYESLNLLKHKFPLNFKIEFLFSNAGNLFKAHLHGNLIEKFLQLYSNDSFDKALYYLCGPEAYMRLCIFTLHGLYVPSHQIKKEIFHTSKPTVKLEPPDKNQHKVSITINSETYILDVRYPTTILQAAKMRGIVLPYSCEVGKCGNCMAVCDNGKIWMSYNEVLTENELDKGLILTCTGFPVFGDVELSFDKVLKE
jgi:ring-1,2-phenylacetyl-CoA epoxidase subunit PaaE